MRNNARSAVVLYRNGIWLAALEGLLERLGVAVIATATTAPEATAIIAELQPTIFIADCSVLAGSPDGWAPVRQGASQQPPVHSVIVSNDDDPRQIETAFAAGASVFCVKTAAPEDVASAVRQGFEPSVFYAGARVREAPSKAITDVGLTKREVEILQLVTEGYANGQVARLLWVTEQTVKFHLSNIYRKLQVGNRTEAARWAQVNGVVDMRGSAAA